MIWFTEPNQREDQRTMILLHNGVRYICPMTSNTERSIRWSIQALKDLAKIV